RSGSGSVDLASKEVAVSTNTLTIADIRKRDKGFFVRQYLDGFKKQGRHDLPCDAEATQFLQVWLDSNYGGALWTNQPAVQALAEKIALRPDGEDPLILTVAAANGNEVHEKRRRLEHAVAGFENSQHKAFPKFYATVELASHVSRQRVQQLDAS